MDTNFLFSEHRKRILGLLLLQPEKRYHVREMARLTNIPSGNVHRELIKLANSEILIREVSGQQVYYRANTEFPIFNELASILRKTSGLAEVLTEQLAPYADKIDVAFIFGSVGKGKETSGSDVDILIVGEISFIQAVKIFYPVQEKIKREINPKVYTKKEWLKLVKLKNPFIKEIMKNPKIFIIGTENDLT